MTSHVTSVQWYALVMHLLSTSKVDTWVNSSVFIYLLNCHFSLSEIIYQWRSTILTYLWNETNDIQFQVVWVSTLQCYFQIHVCIENVKELRICCTSQSQRLHFFSFVVVGLGNENDASVMISGLFKYSGRVIE